LQPTFYRGTFSLASSSSGSTFVSSNGWGKGMVWINGFNLGRYWNVGPQFSLYCPAGVLQQGTNEIILLELLAAKPDLTVEFLDHQDFHVPACNPLAPAQDGSPVALWTPLSSQTNQQWFVFQRQLGRSWAYQSDPTTMWFWASGGGAQAL
jgi:hypothetical protein